MRPHRTRTDVAYLNTASPPTPSPLKAEFDDTLLIGGLQELRKQLDFPPPLPFYTPGLLHNSKITYTNSL